MLSDISRRPAFGRGTARSVGLLSPSLPPHDRGPSARCGVSWEAEREGTAGGGGVGRVEAGPVRGPTGGGGGGGGWRRGSFRGKGRGGGGSYTPLTPPTKLRVCSSGLGVSIEYTKRQIKMTQETSVTESRNQVNQGPNT